MISSSDPVEGDCFVDVMSVSACTLCKKGYGVVWYSWGRTYCHTSNRVEDWRGCHLVYVLAVHTCMYCSMCTVYMHCSMCIYMYVL